MPLTDRGKMEIVLCDSHSTDRTREIAERFDPGCPYRIVQPPAHLPNRTEIWNYGPRDARTGICLDAPRSPVLAMIGEEDAA